MKYLTKQEAKELLKDQWPDFQKWIVGQTCPIIDGKPCYYGSDVDQFLSGNRVIWD